MFTGPPSQMNEPVLSQRQSSPASACSWTFGSPSSSRASVISTRPSSQRRTHTWTSSPLPKSSTSSGKSTSPLASVVATTFLCPSSYRTTGTSLFGFPPSSTLKSWARASPAPTNGTMTKRSRGTSLLTRISGSWRKRGGRMQAAWRSWSAYQKYRDSVNSLTDLREDLRDVLPPTFGAAADGRLDLVRPLPPGAGEVLLGVLQEGVEELLAIEP